uniref:Mediator of RNA polymerase II transcription subunit 20 n=1 Tax=Athene cunicularia TaxID=194338 RepID=A0A663MBV4_ATHCN
QVWQRLPAVPVSKGQSLEGSHKKDKGKARCFFSWFYSPNTIALISGQTGKLMYVMHNSEYPLSCFALFENGPCLIADANFDTLMVKLKGFFQNAKANKIESRGTRYQYCDFLVKVGTVTMGPSARGISVEVEYCPCVIANDCWNLLMEFMQSFMGNHTPGIPSVFGTKHDSIYSPADTMVQYMELFNKIRKQQQVPVAGIR